MSDIRDVTHIIAKQMEIYKFPFEKVWDEYVPGAIKLEFTKAEIFNCLRDGFDELFLSPLPWKMFLQGVLDNDGEHVAQFEKNSDIEYAMKCINMHDELVGSLKDFKYLCEIEIAEFSKDALIKRDVWIEKIDELLKKDSESNFETTQLDML